jgi:hypothetical protein
MRQDPPIDPVVARWWLYLHTMLCPYGAPLLDCLVLDRPTARGNDEYLLD